MRLPITILLVFSAFTVLITGFWDQVSSWLLPNTIWGLYSRGFFENVLVEAHGAIIDLLVVGVVLYWFEHRRDTAAQVRRHQDMLADLRSYRAADSSFRTLGTIKRLLELGVQKLHLSEMSLAELQIEGIKLKDCDLHAVVFTNSHLRQVALENCACDAAIFAGATLEHAVLKFTSFRRAKFQGATLKGADFRTCGVEGADFTNAILRSSNFSQVDCRAVNFRGADLRSANFKGAKNLTAEMIRAASSIKSLKTDDPAIAALVAAAKK